MHAPFSSFVILLCVIVVLTNLSTVKPSPSSSSPTAIPTTISPSIIAPTFTPSFAPTASQSTVSVGTDGYVYIQIYTASDCGGSKSFVRGFLTNYCFSTGSYYSKYMFTKGR